MWYNVHIMPVQDRDRNTNTSIVAEGGNGNYSDSGGVSHQSYPELVPDGWVHPLDIGHTRGRAAQLDSNGLPPYDKMPFRMPKAIQGRARMPTLQETVLEGLKAGIARSPQLQDKRDIPRDVTPEDAVKRKKSISALLSQLFND